MPQPIDLTAQLAALLASGGNLPDLPDSPAVPDPGPDEEEGGPEPETNDEPTDPVVPVVPVAPESKDNQSLIELATQLGSANARLEAAHAEIEGSKSQLAAVGETSTKACSVIRLSVQRLSTALNSPVAGIESLSLSALCEQFDALNAEFTKRFTPGQKSNQPPVKPKALTSVDKARQRSTKPTTSR